jgi:hypothetical protein
MISISPLPYCGLFTWEFQISFSSFHALLLCFKSLEQSIPVPHGLSCAGLCWPSALTRLVMPWRLNHDIKILMLMRPHEKIRLSFPFLLFFYPSSTLGQTPMNGQFERPRRCSSCCSNYILIRGCLKSHHHYRQRTGFAGILLNRKLWHNMIPIMPSGADQIVPCQSLFPTNPAAGSTHRMANRLRALD